ncbi:MAG: discoidin domain-containing protein [Bacteroidaceae bacterium]|nr:discoidin domain-containing protein [Bacteroidaceae bacterium]
MKTRMLLAILFCTILVLWPTRSIAVVREVENLNREWKFFLGDCPQAEMPVFNDSHWETVGLPHSFSMPYFMSTDFYTGYGWYRKQIELTSKDLQKVVFLEFDGVFQEAEIYVNGKLIGNHVGGYTGFCINITEALKSGGNQIAVRVNNLWRADVAPRAGEHTFSGGIYRNVRLVKKSLGHIDWYGTFVTTPDLGMSAGAFSTLNVETQVCNLSGVDETYRLETLLLSPEGKMIASVESEDVVGACTKKIFTQSTEKVMAPRLWSPDSPTLYKVVSRLYVGRRLLDEEVTEMGFRWFQWTADRGFFLNGKHLYFHGANVHQDQAGWGDAVTEAAMRRDVLMMKEAGFDLIRGSHYPHAPAFSRACDRLGMLLWSEAPFWGIGGHGDDGYWNSSAYPVNPAVQAGFEESALQQLAEMIRIHRNHPSIVAWSMCNEAFFSSAEALPGVHRLLKRMVDLTHQLDPTRPAAVGGAQRPLGDARIDRIGDIAGYNGDGATQSDFQQPGVASVVSEYGSTTADRPGEYAPGWGDLKVDDGWRGRSWRSGQAIWCGFDHGSIAGNALGKMGIVDYFRLPKRAWYWYRNEYNGVVPPAWSVDGTPHKLLLTASNGGDILADGTDDVQLVVTVLDNEGRHLTATPPVQLRVVSGPGEFPTGRTISFRKDSDIRIMDGQCAITFRSYYAGKTVIEAVSPGLQSARVELRFTGAPKYHEGKSPVVKERPYIRFVRGDNSRPVLTFGPNNPTFAGSQQVWHGAGLAADGNAETYWKPEERDADPWWMLDTEKRLELRNISIVFPKDNHYCYVVEGSDDKENWTVLSDKSRSDVKVRSYSYDFDTAQSVKARFIRIRFMPGSPAALSEVTVRGVVQNE